MHADTRRWSGAAGSFASSLECRWRRAINPPAGMPFVLQSAANASLSSDRGAPNHWHPAADGPQRQEQAVGGDGGVRKNLCGDLHATKIISTSSPASASSPDNTPPAHSLCRCGVRSIVLDPVALVRLAAGFYAGRKRRQERKRRWHRCCLAGQAAYCRCADCADVADCSGVRKLGDISHSRHGGRRPSGEAMKQSRSYRCANRSRPCGAQAHCRRRSHFHGRVCRGKPLRVHRGLVLHPLRNSKAERAARAPHQEPASTRCPRGACFRRPRRSAKIEEALTGQSPPPAAVRPHRH